MSEKKQRSILEVALSGGIPGMAAMTVQVTTLMWLRTTMNYQYKYGTTTTEAMRQLYKQGGIPRFYSGYSMALLQGPLSRFGDTAANKGILALLDQKETTRNLPIPVKTAAASLSAAAFRTFLMPIDTMKTMLQVEGANGWKVMANKVKTNGPSVLFHGSIAASTATFAGHYPWYTTYNYLNIVLPEYKQQLSLHLLRSAFIGFCASLVSDTVSNSFRVVKTAKQTSTKSSTYSQIIHEILKKDGAKGLLGRGLKTRLLTNGIQGLLFSVLWTLGQNYYEDMIDKKEKKAN